MRRFLSLAYLMLNAMIRHRRVFEQAIKTVPSICSGYGFSLDFENTVSKAAVSRSPTSKNQLWEYFQNHKEGPGIWKWEHYFDIYHRHFAKFVGQDVDVLEIGIYSGGSLDMWRSYFGERSHIYGVDIEPACKAYENDHVSIFIGDQADRAFWSAFKNSVKGIDILIDDGGHTPEQQQITLEEMLQHLRPGGVYVCEDIHFSFNKFSAFVTGLVNNLNTWDYASGLLPHPHIKATQIQTAIHSIHFYPYLIVIEKNSFPQPELISSKHGTEWQPFL